MNIKTFISLLLLLFSLSGIAQPSRISGFNELMTTLNSGERVRVVIQYKLCKIPDGQVVQSPPPDAITGMDIDTFEYFAPGAAHNNTAFVVFSTSKLIQNPKGKGFVYNYGKVRVTADNSVVVTAKYIRPGSYKVVMDETFLGKINDGTNGEGINLYK